MKYKSERVLISRDGEVFRSGDFLSIIYTKCFVKKTISGRLHSIDLGIFSDIANVDVSKECLSDIKEIQIDDISSIEKLEDQNT